MYKKKDNLKQVCSNSQVVGTDMNTKCRSRKSYLLFPHLPGKSFLAECYAGSIGIPCVKLRNFRSKYVGETEGNLQRVLTVLRSLGPVVVIIDEADRMLDMGFPSTNRKKRPIPTSPFRRARGATHACSESRATCSCASRC